MIDSFRLRTRETDGIVIVTTDGYINNSAGDEIAEICHEQIKNGKNKFLFNMAKSAVINSVGVSVFIEIIENLQKSNGQLGFCNLVPIVHKTFVIMGLTKYATVFETEEEAIEILKK